ncbi:MAG: hypothetical protein RIT27_1425 [Pseudomonadota bacterium]|jgi:3-deoxy-D-manno-octulosonate 8-phosphate phosphatase KdsC-like HAD superfamily phosphatase
MFSNTKFQLSALSIVLFHTPAIAEERLLVDPLFQQIILDFKTDAVAITAKYYVAPFNINNKKNAYTDLLKQTGQRYNLPPQEVDNFLNSMRTTPLGTDSWSATVFHIRKALLNWVDPLINLTNIDLSKATDENFIINNLKPLLADQTVLTSYDYYGFTPMLWQLVKLKNNHKVGCEQWKFTSTDLNQHIAQTFAKEFSVVSQIAYNDLYEGALSSIGGKILNQEGYPISIFPYWLNLLVFGVENLAVLQHENLLELQTQINTETNSVVAIGKQLQTIPATLPTDVATLKTFDTNVGKYISDLENVEETCVGTTGKTTLLTTAQQKQLKIEAAIEIANEAIQEGAALANQIDLEKSRVNAISAHLQSYPAVLPTDLTSLQNLNIDVNTQITTLENFEETVPNSTGKATVLAAALQLQMKIESAIDTAKELLSEQDRLKATYQQLSTVALQSPSASFTSDDFDYAVSEIIKPNVTLKTMITLLDNLEKLKGSTYANAGAAKAAYDDLIDLVQTEIDSVNNFTLQLFVNPQTVNNPLFGYQGVSFYVTNGPKKVAQQMIALYNQNRQHPLDMSPLNDRIFNGEMPQSIMDALYTKKPKLVRSNWIDVNNFKDQFLSSLREGGLFTPITAVSGRNYSALSDTLTADLFLD